ncbi:MAG TPA: hypothetical protein VIV82_04155 [Verrucomicrobiae bacterium]|jgi:hypothetical protein
MIIHRSILWRLLLVALVIGGGCQHRMQPTTGSRGARQTYDYVIADQSAQGAGFGGRRIFVVGDRRFTSESAFISWVVSLPHGASLYWDSGCAKYDLLPLKDSTMKMSEFKKFCTDHGIKFVWRFGY